MCGEISYQPLISWLGYETAFSFCYLIEKRLYNIAYGFSQLRLLFPWSDIGVLKHVCRFFLRNHAKCVVVNLYSLLLHFRCCHMLSIIFLDKNWRSQETHAFHVENIHHKKFLCSLMVIFIRSLQTRFHVEIIHLRWKFVIWILQASKFFSRTLFNFSMRISNFGVSF